MRINNNQGNLKDVTLSLWSHLHWCDNMFFIITIIYVKL